MTYDPDDPRLTAYALGELDEADRLAIEAQLAQCEESRRTVDDVRATAQLLGDALRDEPSPGLAPAQHEAIESELAEARHAAPAVAGSTTRGLRLVRSPWVGLAVAATLLVACTMMLLPAVESVRRSARRILPGRAPAETVAVQPSAPSVSEEVQTPPAVDDFRYAANNYLAMRTTTPDEQNAGLALRAEVAAAAAAPVVPPDAVAKTSPRAPAPEGLLGAARPEAPDVAPAVPSPSTPRDMTVAGLESARPAPAAQPGPTPPPPAGAGPLGPAPAQAPAPAVVAGGSRTGLEPSVAGKPREAAPVPATDRYSEFDVLKVPTETTLAGRPAASSSAPARVAGDDEKAKLADNNQMLSDVRAKRGFGESKQAAASGRTSRKALAADSRDRRESVAKAEVPATNSLAEPVPALRSNTDREIKERVARLDAGDKAQAEHTLARSSAMGRRLADSGSDKDTKPVLQDESRSMHFGLAGAGGMPGTPQSPATSPANASALGMAGMMGGGSGGRKGAMDAQGQSLSQNFKNGQNRGMPHQGQVGDQQNPGMTQNQGQGQAGAGQNQNGQQGAQRNELLSKSKLREAEQLGLPQQQPQDAPVQNMTPTFRQQVQVAQPGEKSGQTAYSENQSRGRGGEAVDGRAPSGGAVPASLAEVQQRQAFFKTPAPNAGQNPGTPAGQVQESMPQANAAVALGTREGFARAARDNKDLADLAGVKQKLENQVELQQVAEAANTEAYNRIVDNPFTRVDQSPLSTFSIDVDTASYANVRRFLEQGQRPPRDAVRIEELLNYFTYNDPAPTSDDPFSINIELARCPWNAEHRLARVGLKGREVEFSMRPPSNLVFLVDVSGSMQDPNKLTLVKEALRMLVEKLGENDRVALAVYAGNQGLVLPSTSCAHRDVVIAALDRLEAGGSTNGGAGIRLAYDLATQNFVKGGTNRVILCTDGDFNVGITNIGDLTRLIEEKAKSRVFLSVLGFGMGNLKDATMETLADKGNGNYAYIDSVQEARKVLVDQAAGTLITIAKDVKIQVEFNPTKVGAYRLIGYENRMLRDQDFNDDTKDAGEIGSGHSVTALYELVPPGKDANVPGVDPLRYQQKALAQKGAEGRKADERLGEQDEVNRESFVVKLRYKQPEGDKSKKIERAVVDDGHSYEQASADYKFAASVAAFGMILRDSPYKGSITLAGVLELASESVGSDPNGYRKAFLTLVRQAQQVIGQ